MWLRGMGTKTLQHGPAGTGAKGVKQATRKSSKKPARLLITHELLWKMRQV